MAENKLELAILPWNLDFVDLKSLKFALPFHINYWMTWGNKRKCVKTSLWELFKKSSPFRKVNASINKHFSGSGEGWSCQPRLVPLVLCQQSVQKWEASRWAISGGVCPLYKTHLLFVCTHCFSVIPLFLSPLLYQWLISFLTNSSHPGTKRNRWPKTFSCNLSLFSLSSL